MTGPRGWLRVGMVPLAAAACGGQGVDANAIVDGAPAIDAAAGGADAVTTDANLARFSFFVTSMQTMIDQSGNPLGFGGDLGGLAGADSICQVAATAVGAGDRTWRAFLSTYNDGAPVHAIDRVGAGPWYDRNDRLIALDRAGLLEYRPAGEVQAVNDLADEHGRPLSDYGDSHDVLTGTYADGQLLGTGGHENCDDWTNATTAVGQGSATHGGLGLGHAWPARSGFGWIYAHEGHGCAPGINLVQNGAGEGNTVGQGGGWGAIYCFAL